MQAKKYTVSELTNTIKYLLEGNPNLQNITLNGEITNYTKHYSGHLYFSLKDDQAQIRGIMFKSYADKLTFIPKNGDKVEVRGTISVYPPQGSYSIQVVSMKEEGEGELYLKYLELKKTLEELGWFNKPKKAIPAYPKKIGVVTSRTGAVIQDIRDTVNRRYPLAEIILYQAPVQGKGANEIIANQIKRANKEKIVDVLIVGRGGGSMEDLWEFNEIAVVDAIYNSELPIITAIGHETDNSLSDFVSDLRAPTPTAAAERATPNQEDLLNLISKSYDDIENKLKNLIRQHQSNLMHLSERLEQSSPHNKIKANYNDLKNNTRLLNYYYNDIIKTNKTKLNELKIKTMGASPIVKLEHNFTKIAQLKAKIGDLYYYKLRQLNERHTLLNSKIKSPIGLINNYQNNLVKLRDNLHLNYQNVYAYKENNYNYQINLLEKINPLAIMKRGFAVINNEAGEIIQSVAAINKDDLINIAMHDGNINAKVINKKGKDD